jgi:hypothetical protein
MTGAHAVNNTDTSSSADAHLANRLISRAGIARHSRFIANRRRLNGADRTGLRTPAAAHTDEEDAMANKDKGGAKDKKVASKSLKEKREAKKAKNASKRGTGSA